MSGLTTSESNNIYSPPGNSLAVFLDKNGTLQLKDINGKTFPLSNYISGGGGGTPTLPDVFLGYIQRSSGFNGILNNFNLTVLENTIPVLFVTTLPVSGAQAISKRYLWKLGPGEFFPIGSTNIESKLELISESFISSDDIDIILNDPNAQEIALGVISEDFISYMNSNGPYVFNDVNKTYVVTFTQDDIDYAYIFQGTLGTYGAGNLQFVPDDFIFIYQSTNAGEPTNSTYIKITRLEAETLQAKSSFIPGATYVIGDADVNLYGGTEITLTAITSNQLSLQGSGLFYCPKYDLSAGGTGYGIWTTYMEGLFSNVVGTFTSGETITAQNGATAKYLAEGFLEWISGDWSGATSISGAIATADVSDFVSPSYAIGTIVHWGGKSWTNVNGNVGASVDKYTLDAEWTEIPFNATDYNVYVDEIQYDFGNDMIIYRKDRYNNVVSGSNQVFVEFELPDGYGYGNPIKDFQWGCAQDDFNTDDYLYIGIQGNQVIDSYFETLNSLAKYIWFNELSQLSYIQDNTLSSSIGIQGNTLSKLSRIQDNILSSNSSIQDNILSSNSSIQDNTLSSSSRFSYNTLSGSSNIFNNTLIGSSIFSYTTLSGSTDIQNNTLSDKSKIQNNTFSNGSLLQFSGGILVSKTLTRLTMVGNNATISISATIVFNQNISKTIFKREDGVSRLQYVNNSDVIVITDMDA